MLTWIVVAHLRNAFSPAAMTASIFSVFWRCSFFYSTSFSPYETSSCIFSLPCGLLPSFFSFRLLLLAVEMLFFVFSFSRLRFLFSACVLALFVSCAGGGGGGGGGSGGGTSPRAPFSFADESIVGGNVSIDGDYRELRSQRFANFSLTVLCSGVCDEEREFLFFRSLDDEISLQDEEVGSVLRNVSTGAQELTVRFEAKRPGHYYYGVCIGEHCSAGVRLVVSGVAVTGVDVKFVVSGLAVLDVSADLVENDDRLNVTTALFCYGRQPCSDFSGGLLSCDW